MAQDTTQEPKRGPGRPAIPPMTRTEARNKLGRGKFTLQQAADKLGVSYLSARRAVQRAVDAGVLEPVDVLRTGERGRPSTLYRLAAK